MNVIGLRISNLSLVRIGTRNKIGLDGFCLAAPGILEAYHRAHPETSGANRGEASASMAAPPAASAQDSPRLHSAC